MNRRELIQSSSALLLGATCLRTATASQTPQHPFELLRLSTSAESTSAPWRLQVRHASPVSVNAVASVSRLDLRLRRNGPETATGEMCLWTMQRDQVINIGRSVSVQLPNMAPVCLGLNYECRHPLRYGGATTLVLDSPGDYLLIGPDQDGRTPKRRLRQELSNAFEMVSEDDFVALIAQVEHELVWLRLG